VGASETERGVNEPNEGGEMMEDEYTKEEWMFNDNTVWGWRSTPYSITCRKHGAHSVTIAAIRSGTSIPYTEKRANALLIAAAPKLLTVLTEMLRVFPDIERDDETVKVVAAARKVLARARGHV